ncbi:MAG: chromate efflux transporter [Pseudomonadota bacterium]
MSAPPITQKAALRIWLQIAALSFGGPVGQIAIIQRIVVEEHRLISQEQLLRALNFCMVLPGPEAQQLVTYIGWMLHGVRGGLTAGLLFILPGFLSILALSLAYYHFAAHPNLQAAFWGMKATILAIIIIALGRIALKILQEKILFVLSGMAFVAIFFFRVPFPLIILAGGCIGAIGYVISGTPHTQPPRLQISVSSRQSAKTLAIWLSIWLLPIGVIIAIFGYDHLFSQIGVFFAKLAMVTFGGAYAVLSYMAQAAVNDFGWLTPAQMLDGLAMAESTPGPLIQIVQFVGFVAATSQETPSVLQPVFASILATWVTFAPCFLWIFLGAPYMEFLQSFGVIAQCLRAITACVVGVIANLALWFSIHVLFGEHVKIQSHGSDFIAPIWTSLDPAALGILVLALVMSKHVNLFCIIGFGIIAGLVLHGSAIAPVG